MKILEALMRFQALVQREECTCGEYRCSVHGDRILADQAIKEFTSTQPAVEAEREKTAPA